MFIYLIVNHVTGKYYVGQHKGKNLRKYLQQKMSHARSGVSENSHLYASMRKHPNLSDWSIHALRSDIQSREELDRTENDFIKFLKAQDEGFGYNLRCGTYHPPEGRAKNRVFNSLIVDKKELWEKQGRRCIICQESLLLWDKFTSHIDRDAATGEVRGLLCHRCKCGLRGFRDNQIALTAAIDYLRHFEVQRHDRRKKIC